MYYAYIKLIIKLQQLGMFRVTKLLSKRIR